MSQKIREQDSHLWFIIGPKKINAFYYNNLKGKFHASLVLEGENHKCLSQIIRDQGSDLDFQKCSESNNTSKETCGSTFFWQVS